MEILVAGEAVVLMPQRTVYWPSQRTLLVADLHLGKADAARAEGAPVPAGVASALQEKHLARLGEAVVATGAARVIVLGDLLHAPAGLSHAMVEGVRRWRGTLAAAIDVVPGNHDRRLESVAEAWAMNILDTRVCLDAFELVHDPAMATGETFAWCGHLHPAVRLASGGDAMRLPAFHLKERFGVLPAFTSLASGKQMRVDAGDRIYGVAAGRVFELPAAENRGAPARGIMGCVGQPPPS